VSDAHAHDEAHASSAGWLTPSWAALIVVAAIAWVITIEQARGMGGDAGTMGKALPLFLTMWVSMMAAMMLPSVAPIAVMWSKVITARSRGRERALRTTEFIAGYLAAWSGYGVLAFGALLATERLAATAPTAASWLGVAAFAVGGLYQLTPLKDVCLRHCRSPMMALLHYANFSGRARDLRVGLHHGAYCVGCCWGLMIVLVAVGVMNVAAMAALAAVIFVEKLWRHGRAVSKLVGVAFLVVAVLAPFYPWLLPALNGDTPPMSSPGVEGM
jgi:predicted metal-binding membrane protein